MGGDKSKISVKKINYAMEVGHQGFKEPVIITRKDFDDKNFQAIEKLLSYFSK
jgi:ABC-type nitrate/sulfonate/bicarbonate transport system substrate-binding protein